MKNTRRTPAPFKKGGVKINPNIKMGSLATKKGWSLSKDGFDILDVRGFVILHTPLKIAMHENYADLPDAEGAGYREIDDEESKDIIKKAFKCISLHDRLLDALKTIQEYHGDILLPVIKHVLPALIKEAEQK